MVAIALSRGHREEKALPASDYTVTEAAKVLRMHPESVRRMLRQGRIKGVIWSPRAGWRISEADLEHFRRTGGRDQGEQE